MLPKADLYIRNASHLVTCISTGNDLLGRVTNGSMAVLGDKIIGIGREDELEESIDVGEAEIIDGAGMVVAPGFVDCHSHVVFGKSRTREFALKMTRTAADIEESGLKTGIPASILMTRHTGEDELFATARDRVEGMMRYGTTTIESKSGYGMTLPDELKMLRVTQRLNLSLPVDVVSTFLGGHDFPPEINRDNKKQREAYLKELMEVMIPAVAGEHLAEYCDIYCDTGYYTVKESEEVLRAGLNWGLKPRIHTDAYANIGGSTLAAEIPTVTADHLNYSTPAEMKLMAENNVIGVVLPALDFAVAHPHPFNARAMLNSGMTLALGTNLNPGNWTESMQLVMQFACRNHGMSPEEAMLAATAGAARALEREDRIGVLAAGFQADIQVWDLPTFEDVIYRIGNNAVALVIKKGKIVVRRDEQ